MTSLPLWSRVLAFLGAAFAVWMVTYAVFTLWLLFHGSPLDPYLLIVVFLAFQVFMWWRLWSVMVFGRRFLPFDLSGAKRQTPPA
jgi:hypothetical protein